MGRSGEPSPLARAQTRVPVAAHRAWQDSLRFGFPSRFAPAGASRLRECIPQVRAGGLGAFGEAGDDLAMLRGDVLSFTRIGGKVEEGELEMGNFLAVAASDGVHAGILDRARHGLSP